jgi:hypothetical protein
MKKFSEKQGKRFQRNCHKKKKPSASADDFEDCAFDQSS